MQHSDLFALYLHSKGQKRQGDAQRWETRIHFRKCTSTSIRTHNSIHLQTGDGSVVSREKVEKDQPQNARIYLEPVCCASSSNCSDAPVRLTAKTHRSTRRPIPALSASESTVFSSSSVSPVDAASRVRSDDAQELSARAGRMDGFYFARTRSASRHWCQRSGHCQPRRASRRRGVNCPCEFATSSYQHHLQCAISEGRESLLVHRLRLAMS